MRKIDIERSRDSYKECLKSALYCMAEMAKCYERRDHAQIKRIKELEEKLPTHSSQEGKVIVQMRC